MQKKSTNANTLKIIQGGEAAVVKSAKALTHKDIKEFLAKFAEAVMVDRERVKKLPRKKFHSSYDDGFWQRKRDNHVCAIIDLSMTVDKMPNRLLKQLTDLAIFHKPEVVKQSLVNIIGELAASSSLDEAATLFFRDLIADVSRQAPGKPFQGTPVESILRWFDYDDPILIATKPKCEYAKLLASHIEKESKKTKCALAAQARLAFEEARVHRECNPFVVSVRRLA